MALIEKHLHQFFEQRAYKTIWVGLSGGVDSIVLLHALKRALPKANIKAIHINHQLQVPAKDWEQFCFNICKQLDIGYLSLSVTVKQHQGESIEAAAREARYGAFIEIVQKEECICTAHHEDDQAETFLLQLMRGAGLTGLQALLPLQSFGKGMLLRPLLGINRAKILEYAKDYALSWIDDPMNQDAQYDRVFVRQEVLPLLMKRWPAAKRKIAQSARLLQESQEIINETVRVDYLSVLLGSELDCEKLSHLPLARKRLILRYWIKQAGFLLPSEKVLQNIIDECIYAKQDANPLVIWKSAEVRRFQNKLYIMAPLAEVNDNLVVEWENFPESIILPNKLDKIGVEDLYFFSQEEKDSFLCDGDRVEKISLRFRQGGETVKVRQHHRPLKKILQEMDIEPWRRERSLLVYKGKELVAMVIK